MKRVPGDPEGNDRPPARRPRPPPPAAFHQSQEAEQATITLLLRKENAQDRIEGRKPFAWKDTDYAVLDDETRIGRMYLEQMPAGRKWCWFLHVMGASSNSGHADTIDEAKAGIAELYARCQKK